MTRIRTRPARAALAAATVAPCLLLVAGVLAPASLAAPATAGATTAGAAASIPAPVHRGTLRITGPLRDGATVTAAGRPCRPAACSTPASSRWARTGCKSAQRTGPG